MSTTIEDDLRVALRAAASTVDVQPAPLPAAAPLRAHRRRRVVREAPLPPHTRRWVIPAAAAAVVVAVGVPLAVLLIAKDTAGPDISAASVVHTDGARAMVAGIGFPVPDGWTVAVVGHDATSVTACVAPTPSADCTGVSLHIAVPDGSGDITPVPDALTARTGTCPPSTDAGDLAGTYAMVVDFAAIGGRPAVHEDISCGPDGPQTASWYVTDGSLAVFAPPGAGSAGAQVVSGIDFAKYAHDYGPQVMFFSPSTGIGAASSAPPTG